MTVFSIDIQTDESKAKLYGILVSATMALKDLGFHNFEIPKILEAYLLTNIDANNQMTQSSYDILVDAYQEWAHEGYTADNFIKDLLSAK